MPKILHIGDIHLDSPFSLFDVEKSQARRQELRGTFTSIMMYAKMKEADLVIIAGDLFDSEFVTKETMSLIVSQFAANPSCRFVITPGNHDPATEKSAYIKTKFPENVYIFKSENVEKFSFDDIGTDVYGFAYVEEKYEQNPLEGRLELDRTKINIFAAHADITNRKSTYCPMKEWDFAVCGFDYAALGHIHAGGEIEKTGETYYAYCGCPEGRSFDECGVKGGIFINAEKKDGVLKIDFERPRFCKKRYEKTETDVSGMKTREEALAAIKKAVTENGYGKDTLLRVKLTGVVSPEADFEEDKIEAADAGVFYIEVENSALPLLDYDELSADITIKGALFRELLPKLESRDEHERRLASLALKYGLAALSGNEIK
ncbi:MAG: DNA repair exonuclease [Clostridia bacterium]|nr:DNA repair exonuclease [Clostridia bacterium]